MSHTRITPIPWRRARLAAGVCFAAALAGGLLAQEIPLTVQLTSSMSSASARKGDPVSAKVASPDSLRGDTILGTVSKAINSRNQSSVAFTFNMLSHGGANIPINATLQAIANSKGSAAVDEGGQALRAANSTVNTGNRNGAPTTSRIGGQLGGLIGGRAGQVVNDASSDVNTSGSAATGSPSTVMEVSASAKGLNLAPGATLTISARSTGGGASLGSLAPNPPSAAASASAAAPAAFSNAPSASPPSAGGQPDLKSTKIEFVPGERTVWFEDFSDMAPDDPPPHWKVRDGTVQLRMGGGTRELYSETGVNLTSESFVMPPNFTFEIDWTGGGQMTWHFLDKENHEVMIAMVRGEPDGNQASTSLNVGEELGSGQTSVNTNVPVHFAIWAQQGRVRAYINGARLVDANQVKFGPIDHILLNFAGYRPNGLRQVRIAESAPDFSAVLNSTGKYVTHGILFDTDSARLKPESGAVLRQVVAALTRNPNLKLEIDGYTDTTGNPDHNLDLSKRRAQAVQSVLVSQFGIDAERLSSNGYGGDNPIASNDTPDGRANNRRVEFSRK
jgi:outer membrane protein OmpA-like peptidoglycan-associated protein